MHIQAEITRLKALREFGGALNKPYEDWTDEEKRACCMLDMLWRREHGFTDKPDPEDERHLSTLGKRLYKADDLIKEDWRAGIMRLGGEWTKAEAGKYESDPRFLRKLYKGITKLWKKTKELFGFKDKDDVSPFEAIRAEKMLETPGLDFEAETKRILEQDYRYTPPNDPVKNEYHNAGLAAEIPMIDSLPPLERERFDQEVRKATSNMMWLEKQAASKFAPESEEFLLESWKIQKDYENSLQKIAWDAKQRMEAGATSDREVLRKAMGQKELAKITHSRTFAAALEKPYSQWTQEERTACHVLDALWRREHGWPDQPRARDNEHWDQLCKSIQNADAGDLKIWKADIAGCGGAAMKKMKTDYKNQAGFWKLTWNRMGQAWDKLAGFESDISPFEAIRAQKVLDDPKIDIAQATKEIQRHAMDGGAVRRSMGMPAPKTCPEPHTMQIVRDGRFEGEEYKSVVSEAYSKGDLSRGDPIDLRMSGPGGNVRVRAMSREDGCLNCGIKEATGLFWERCDEIRMGALAKLETEGIMNVATVNGGKILAARGSAIATVETAEEAILAKAKARAQEVAKPEHADKESTPAMAM